MIHFEYDPQLVEQATFLFARADSERECALHEALDPNYRIEDLEIRQDAFRGVYVDFFRRFELDRIVPALTDAFPYIRMRVPRCLVREAERFRSQSVDLYQDKLRRADTQVLIIAVCPEFLLNPGRRDPWMYRQFQHIEDMLDHHFCYDRQLPQLPVAQQNLIRDRYAVLWDTYVEGRLMRAGKIDGSGVAALQRSFSITFGDMSGNASRITFEEVFRAGALTHARLLSWASGSAWQWDDSKGGNNEHIAAETVQSIP